MTIKDVAQALDLDWDLVKEIDKRSLAIQVSGIPLDEVKILAIDEFAIHKGHRYATVVIDIERGHVLWVGHGRKREDIRPFFAMLGPERCARIEAVAIDCSNRQNNPTLNDPFQQVIFAVGGTTDATTWRGVLARGDTETSGERHERREVLPEAPS